MSAPNVSRKIRNLLTKLVNNKDDEVKGIAKELITKVVLPAANPDDTNASGRKKIRSLAFLKPSTKSWPELVTVSVPNTREEKLRHPPHIRNGNAKSNLVDECFPSHYDIEDGKHLKKSGEHFADKFARSWESDFTSVRRDELEDLEAIDFSWPKFGKRWSVSMQVSKMFANAPTKMNCENVSQEVELEMISKDIDKLEESINESRKRIKHFRDESVYLLTKELSDSAIDNDSESVDSRPTFLEIEKEINRLEIEKDDFESKRRKAVSRLQDKIWGNIKALEHQERFAMVDKSNRSSLSPPTLSKRDNSFRTVTEPAFENTLRKSSSESEISVPIATSMLIFSNNLDTKQ